VNEVIELVAHARRRAEAAGRDPDALELTVMFRPDRDSAERWAEAGADRVVVVLPTTEDVERHGAEVIAKLGGSGARAGTT
jgi:alkanesulfonate monooxygenase SsuD/methylene tetrahydromethanopterin reductase-like flavin-dependent oxidoreductase (luciferase family)